MTIVELALLSTLFISSVIAQATLEQWYVHHEASLEFSCQYVSIFLFASGIRLSTRTYLFWKQESAKPRSSQHCRNLLHQWK